MIKLKILSWRDYNGLSGWAQCNHKNFYKREVGGPKSEKGDVMAEPEVRVMPFAHGGRSQKPKNADGKGKKTDPLLKTP